MKPIALAALAAFALLPVQAAHAALIGAPISETYYYPTDVAPYAGATYTPQNFVVGGGEESVIDIEGVTYIHVDFGATTLGLLLNTTLPAPVWGTAGPYNGPIFSGAAISGITGVLVNSSSTLAGFDSSRVSIVGNDLRINWGGLSYADGTTLNLDFTFLPDGSAVPEPATWAMMIVGFGLTGAAVRRRKSAWSSQA